jgi:spermidine synthase
MISSGRRSLLLAVAAVSGAAVMTLEMAAPRLFAPWFGTSQPVWTNVIGVVLAALAAGYALGGRLARRSPTPRTPGWVLLTGGLFAVAASRFGPWLASSLLPVATDLEGVPSLLVQGSLVATLLVFGPPMVLLGMVTPLLVQILAEEGESGDAAGRVLGVSTLGSLFGTFLTTHHFLPILGTRATLEGSGAVLAACGLGLLFLGGGGPRALIGGAVMTLITVGAVAAPRGEFRPPAPDSGDLVLAEFDSAYQFLQVREVPAQGADASARAKILTMNEGVRTYHSVQMPGSVLTGGRYYDLYPALPLLAGAKKGAPLRVGILGLAAGTQARALHHFLGADHALLVDGVEIDPAVLEAGHRHFDLPRDADWLRLHATDARAFLAAAPEETYDLLLVDCYSHEYYLPFHLTTVEFFRLARSRLRPGGILAYNAFAYRQDDPLLRALSSSTAEVFGRAWRIPVAGYPNHVIVAWKSDACFDPRGDHLPWEGFARRCDEGVSGDYAAFAARPEGEVALQYAAAAGRAAVAFDPDPTATPLVDDRAPVEMLADRSQAEIDELRRGSRR